MAAACRAAGRFGRFWLRRAQHAAQLGRAGEAPPLQRALFPGCRHFSFEELEEATGGWSARNVIGCGGFGSVYAGRLANGAAVAVKRLDRRGLQVRAGRSSRLYATRHTEWGARSAL